MSLDLKELKDLLDRATPEDFDMFDSLSGQLMVHYKNGKREFLNHRQILDLIEILNNAKELIRLAEIAQKISELKGDINCESCRGVNSVMRAVVPKK